MYDSTIKVSCKASCFPAGITGLTGVTSRDAHRAMFPSHRQENFHSPREKAQDWCQVTQSEQCASG